MMKKFFVSAFVFGLFSVGTGQDIHFSQFRNTPLFVNPAYCGDYPGKMRGIMNYRTQWTSAGAPFKTFGASFDMPVKRGRANGNLFGAGLSFYSDRAGDIKLTNNHIALSGSGIIMLSRRSKLGSGLQLAAGQRSADFSGLLWGSQYTGTGQGYDPNIPVPENTTKHAYWYPDAGLGVFYEYNNSEFSFSGREMFFINVGASAFHVNQPRASFVSSNEKLHMKIVGHVNSRYDFKGTAFGILPSVIYMMQGPSSELNIGALMRYRLNQGTKITGFKSENALYFGFYYRNKDAIIPQFFFEMADYSIGISFDYNISGFSSSTNGNGGFEISLKYNNLTDAVFKREVFD
jgi:type IX secretion system PorP/SprF family membrane protein